MASLETLEMLEVDRKALQHVNIWLVEQGGGRVIPMLLGAETGKLGKCVMGDQVLV